FNTITGKLKSEDRGYNEYGIVMNMIMVLMMVYSSTPCIMTYNRKPLRLTGCLALISTLLGETTESRNGTDLWDMMELFHQSPDLQDLSPVEAYEAAQKNTDRPLYYQFFFTILMDTDMLKMTDETAGMDAENIRNANIVQQKEYLYRFMITHKDEEDFEAWLKALLQSGYDKRMKLAEKEDEYGAAAYLSGFFPAPVLVSLLAKAKGENFWMTWDRLNVQAYRDHRYPLKFPKDDIQEKNETPLPLYRLLQRDSEDEFLEYRDEKDGKFSAELKEQFSRWAGTFRNIEIPSDLNPEQELAGILSDLKNVWNCRLVDQAFVQEFLNQKDDPDHQKLLLVLRDYLNEGTEYFPELTRQQAKEWVLSDCRDENDRILMSAYVSMITNHKLRKHIMGV
ncbi:MAG: hypothetical protein IKD69_04025, partial [Solobacterium sp.]|nr:hypothetical protein [Solobacterium sp.]